MGRGAGDFFGQIYDFADRFAEGYAELFFGFVEHEEFEPAGHVEGFGAVGFGLVDGAEEEHAGFVFGVVGGVGGGGGGVVLVVGIHVVKVRWMSREEG